MTANLKLIAALCVLVAAGCTSADSKAKKEFVNNCRDQGAPKDMCVCAYDKLSEHYSPEVMVRMQEQGLPAPDFAEAVISAALQCRAGDSSSKLALSSDIHGEGEAGAALESVVPGAADIDSAILATAKAEGGDEYRDGRLVELGDLNSDGVPDVAVMFTIEVASENTSTQYLAVMTGYRGNNSFSMDTIAVGGIGRHVQGMSVKDGSIRLQQLDQGPDDADCCPSIESEGEYLWHNGKIKQVN